MSGVQNLNYDQFDRMNSALFGHSSVEENVEDYDPHSMPTSVFRVMSNEHYKASVASGFHQSDERNNWKAQRRQEGASQEEIDAVPEEGTVAGRWIEPGYLPQKGAGRIVRFKTAEHPDWEVHPDVPEGDYIRSKTPIPMSSAHTVSPPIWRNWGGNNHWIVGQE